MPATSFTPATPNATSYTPGNTAVFKSLLGGIMDDATYKMDDSTLTMDDSHQTAGLFPTSYTKTTPNPTGYTPVVP